MELINVSPYIRFANTLCFEQQRGPSKTYDCRFLYTLKGEASLKMADRTYRLQNMLLLLHRLQRVYS